MEQNLTSTKDYSVIINPNSNILSFNKLHNCTINNATIGSSEITDCFISDGSKILHSYLTKSKVLNNAQIGVFSHLREGSLIGENVKIGNFVETKKCEIGNGSKVSHLTYVGDAVIGENVNVGCGVVFCNYNGKIKQQSVVGNNVFLGSNSNIIAPVTISDNSFVAAGSTITNFVPKHCLAIARARQVNKENYLKHV